MKPAAIFAKAFVSIAFVAFVLSSAACSKSDEPLAVVSPIASPAATPAAPIADQPVPDMSSITRMETRLDDIRKCALLAGDAQGINHQNYAQMLAAKGIVRQLQADAQSAASESVAFYDRISPPTSDAMRVTNSLNALSETGFVLTHPPEVRLKANAYVAYYQSLLTGQQCPVDQDILQLINKTKP